MYKLLWLASRCIMVCFESKHSIIQRDACQSNMYILHPISTFDTIIRKILKLWFMLGWYEWGRWFEGAEIGCLFRRGIFVPFKNDWQTWDLAVFDKFYLNGIVLSFLFFKLFLYSFLVLPFFQTSLVFLSWVKIAGYQMWVWIILQIVYISHSNL
jgi:hypothetical protein